MEKSKAFLPFPVLGLGWSCLEIENTNSMLENNYFYKKYLSYGTAGVVRVGGSEQLWRDISSWAKSNTNICRYSQFPFFCTIIIPWPSVDTPGWKERWCRARLRLKKCTHGRLWQSHKKVTTTKKRTRTLTCPAPRTQDLVAQESLGGNSNQGRFPKNVRI